mmetsp:Transcript_36668/g.89637  ORF Transcript_36668/g.89637 Transcript_36668/m.89637 type:complete len:146 (-) Transcript_36668:1181-1618(-)
MKSRSDLVKTSRAMSDFVARLAPGLGAASGEGPFVVAGVAATTTDIVTGERVSAWRALVTAERDMVIEAPNILAPSTKETLMTMVECAEELGCDRVLACIDGRSTSLKQLIRVFTRLGFAIGRASSTAAAPAIAAYVVMEYSISE